MSRILSLLALVVGCQGESPAAYTTPLADPLPPPTDTDTVAAEPAGGVTYATPGPLSHVLAQSAHCVTTSSIAGGGVALLAIGLDDGSVAVMDTFGVGQPDVAGSAAGLVRFGDRFVFPMYAYPDPRPVTVIDLATGSLQLLGTTDHAWLARTGTKLVATNRHGTAALFYKNPRDIAREAPVRTTPVGSVHGHRLGTAPGELLNAWHQDGKFRVLDTSTGTGTRTVRLEDFYTWIDALAGTGDRYLVMDDGRGTWSSHGRRLAVFDLQGGNVANIFFQGLSVPTIGEVSPQGLWCEAP